ncbi:GGDEF domain-containing protein [Sulfurospirillum sp. 1612]|uniref:GGDEF domain-containing protein n=1 Tax=Sulfurospirillum sp. 1612 TaxID=3094835 RepID=UPI002F935457
MFDTKKYDEWLQVSRVFQIRYVAILTALLYSLVAILDSIIIPSEYQSLVHFVHLCILTPILLLIASLSFFKKYYNTMIYLLILAPASAAIGNLLITSQINTPNLYLPEIYLCIFWIFTISGLKLFHATISASIVIMISSFSFFYLTHQEFIMHLFWILSATSFGFLGAFLLERANKKNFLHTKALAKSAQTDTLTKLYNRAKFDNVLSYELQRNRRRNDPIGLAMIDIDYFKSVNDTFGHHIGDMFLIEISQLIKHNIRETDFLARWGGEEFALICVETDIEGMNTLVENIRIAVEQHSFQTIGKKTMSAGVSVYHEGDTNTSLTARADQALYLAKNSGRNNIKILS